MNSRVPLLMVLAILLPETLATPCDLQLNDSHLAPFLNTRIDVNFSSSCCFSYDCLMSWVSVLQNETEYNATQFHEGILLLKVISHDEGIVTAVETNEHILDYDLDHVEEVSEHDMVRNRDFHMAFNIRDHHRMFHLKTDQLGRTKITVQIIWNNSTKYSHYLDANKFRPVDRGAPKLVTYQHYTVGQKNFTLMEAILAETSVDIVVRRKSSILFTAYDWSVAIIACMTAVSVGCCSDFAHWKSMFQARPYVVGMSLFTSHLLMPSTAILISHILNLRKEQAFGLLCVSAMPGGGWAHLMVFLVDGNPHMSSLISQFHCITNVLFSPLWLFFFQSWIYPSELSYGAFLLLLLPTATSQTVGTILRNWRPSCAEAILTWFTRPLLLLAGILFITLGVYLNQYAINRQAGGGSLGALMMLIIAGFLLGGLNGWFWNTEGRSLKSIAAESSVFNCLAAIPALRYAIPQPEGLLVSSVPLFGVFCTPLPLVLFYITKRLQSLFSGILERRRAQQVQAFVQKLAQFKTRKDTPPMNSSMQISTEASAATPIHDFHTIHLHPHQKC